MRKVVSGESHVSGEACDRLRLELVVGALVGLIKDPAGTIVTGLGFRGPEIDL